MARSDTITLIPPDRLAFYLGIDPYHFNQIYTADRPPTHSCNDFWYQHNWQSTGRLSRDEAIAALKQAEDVVAAWLNFPILPDWLVDEQPIQQFHRVESARWVNSRDQHKSVSTDHKWVLSSGVRGSTYIDTPVIVFSDEDGDGYDETATVVFATTVTDEEELRLFYPGEAGRESWEIRPLTSITIAAGIATITFPRYLIPLWNLVERVPSPDAPHIGIDGDDVASFLTEVDAYRIYNDTSTQATLYFEPTDCTTACAMSSTTACAYVRDKRRGIMALQPASYADEAWTPTCVCGLPTKADVYYRAGFQNLAMQYPTRKVDPTLERYVVYYSLALLNAEPHGCDNTLNIWNHQAEDYSLAVGDKRYVIHWDVMRNRLGTTRAAVNLWNYIQDKKIEK